MFNFVIPTRSELQYSGNSIPMHSLEKYLGDNGDTTPSSAHLSWMYDIVHI